MSSLTARYKIKFHGILCNEMQKQLTLQKNSDQVAHKYLSFCLETLFEY
jgi:hypothetical protein